MAVIDLPIVGQSYHLKDWSIDCQRTLNMYPQVVESGNTPQVAALLPTEGLVKKWDFTHRIRGMYSFSDKLLVIAGRDVWLIERGKEPKQVVGMIMGENTVYMADDGVNVFIAIDDYEYSYYYEISTNSLYFVPKWGDDFFGASDVSFLDSRFIWTVPKSGKIQWSNLLSVDTSALNYATAEYRSDNLVRTITSNGQLWLIGEKTTEIWNSTGGADLPFQRQSGAYLPFGCAAKDSVSQFGSNLVWLAQTEHGHAQVVMTQGYQVSRVSNHAVEDALLSYDRIDDAYAFSYQQNGHSFYVISFPTAKKTWAFDAMTQMWHERSFYNVEMSTHEHHRARIYCFFNNQHLVGDRENGKIYVLDANAQTDDGTPIIRERTTPCINPHATRMIFDEVELICQVGQQKNSKPQIMFDWSDDRGKSWSNDRIEDLSQDLGGIGEYQKRVIFRRLGQSFGRVFRVRMTDAGRLVLMGAKAKVRT